MLLIVNYYKSVFWCLLILFVSSTLAGRHIIITKCKQPLDEICIEIRKCPYFADLLDRSSIPRPRGVIKAIREYQCGFSGNMPRVCCNISFPTLPPQPQYTSTTRPTTKISEPIVIPTTTLVNSILDKREDAIQTHKNYYLLPKGKCGHIATNSRITSGSKTSLNEFPWMALIAYSTSEGLDFRCGGTVINERYVLTAAHCVLNSQIAGVRLGEHNLNTVEDCDEGSDVCAAPVQDFRIENVVVHPYYNSKTFENDIALIRLAHSANFSLDNVQPICLPLGESSKVQLAGRYGIVTGWGVTESGLKSVELLKISIPIVPINECQKMYEEFAPISSNQICAGGYLGRDSCGGDSGGPLKYVGSINGTPRYIQYGIVSYGPKHCGTDGQPGIYTRVSSYLQWILDNLEPTEDD